MIKQYFSIFCLLGFLCLATPSIVSAQARITFRIDLKQQIKDSVFIPDKYRIEVLGDQRPLSKYHTFKMKDEPPVDSIYTVEIPFPSSVMGTTLSYNFLIRQDYKTLNERRSRLLPLQPGKRELNVAFFNDFAW